MNNFGVYAATRELISHLEHKGYQKEADTLRAAMEEGATGTEIFMALRYHLDEISTQVPLSGDIDAVDPHL
jgi:hypothetical protein